MVKTRVIISDWQVLFREGIHHILTATNEFEIIGEATAGEAALELIEKNESGIAIINADSGSPSGIDITRRIKLNQPDVGVLLIMDNYNDTQLFAALKSGAGACQSKDMDPDELLSAVRKILRRENPITRALLEPGIASMVNEEFEAFAQMNEESGNLMARLLPVDEQILQYIIHGDVPQEISDSLEISEEDVVRHLGIILEKLISNDRNRELIEAVQGNLSAVISRISKPRKSGKQSQEYITRDEFDAFKERLAERFRRLNGDFD